MYYLWFNDCGAGWELVDSSEDEMYIKKLEAEKAEELSANHFLSWGKSYKMTDYELDPSERKASE